MTVAIGAYRSCLFRSLLSELRSTALRVLFLKPIFEGVGVLE